MKKSIALLVLMLSGALLYGQATEGTVNHQKKEQPAAVIELPYEPETVSAALNDYLSRKGRSRSTTIKGFTTFRNTSLLHDDSTNADLYFKIDRKSRKEKNVTVVSLLLRQPGIGDTSSQRHLDMEGAKTYLNELTPAILAYDLELMIKEQNAAIIRSETKLKELSNEGEDLEKKIIGLQKKREENKADVQKQDNEVQQKRQQLATLVSQRKA